MEQNNKIQNQPEVVPSQDTSLKQNKHMGILGRTHAFWSRYSGLVTIILVFIWITQIILVVLLSKNVKQIITDNAKIEQQLADEKNAALAVEQYETEIEQLEALFPRELGISEFIDQTRNRLSNFPGSNADIAQNQVISTNEFYAPFVPIKITATATPSAALVRLKEVVYSKFLFLPGKLEINAVAGTDEVSSVVLNGNLYVSPDLKN